MPRPVLVKFSHGLGDVVQFTVALKHLAKHRPDWVIDTLAGRGKHSALYGHCFGVYFDGQPRPAEHTYAEVFDVGWFENYNNYPDRPNSKITNCLAEEFGIPYDPALGTYTVHYSEQQRCRVREYLDGIGAKVLTNGRYDVICLHYEGNTSTAKKNLQHHIARAACETITATGYKVVLLDWDNRSPIPNGSTVHKPPTGSGDLWGGFGSGDAATLAALIDQCAGFIGIDSGPGKVASATATPTVIVWTGHHPLQFHDPHEGTLHLIPENHAGLAPVSGDAVKCAYFKSHYRHQTYAPNGLSLELCKLAAGMCGARIEDATTGLVKHGPFWVRRDNFEQDLVIVQDVFYGDAYRTSLYDLTQWDTLVDIGAHIGTFATLVHHMNPACKIVCVEACPENIEALRANVGSFATVIQGAMTYEPGELALLNAVRPGCESTGGSVVVTRASLSGQHDLRQPGYQYWNDLRPLKKVPLADAMHAGGFDHIACLKLDCEGAEYSILANAPEMPRVRFVFGEYHDHARWEELRTAKFAAWNYGKMYEADGRGLFHLVNPNYHPTVSAQSSESKFPDIWKYYTGPLAAAEITAWDTHADGKEPMARDVMAAVNLVGIDRVVEFGCGIGQIASLLPAKVAYIGIDRNQTFLAEARMRNPTRTFIEHDIREPIKTESPAVVCSFGVLQHFSINHFDAIFDRMAARVGYGGAMVFEIPIAETPADDGVEFHHTYLDEPMLAAALARNGLSEYSRRLSFRGTSASGIVFNEVNMIAITSATEPDPEWPVRSGDVDHEMHAVLRRVVRAAIGNLHSPLVIETGIKHGHSGLAILDVCPTARLIGYDHFRDPAHPGSQAIAERNLKGKSYTITVADTLTVGPHPEADLTFVDGCHTFRGCYTDLINSRSAVVIIDDYFPDHPADPVAAAVRWFALNSPDPWRLTEEHVPGGNRLAILDRRPDGGAIGKPWSGVLAVATAAGVGDTAWVVAKAPAIMAKVGARAIDFSTCENDRATGYLRLLPFVRTATAITERMIEINPVVRFDGVYNYAPSQPAWHAKYHLLLQVNGHLEMGKRLEEWFPHLPTDYAAPVTFPELTDDIIFAEEFAKRGPYVTFFAGPLDGNTRAGHNIGGTWKPGNWEYICNRLTAKGVRVVLVGSGPGDQDYAIKLHKAGFFDYGAEDAIGLWELPRTLAVLKRSAGHVGYQSGLGVLSVYWQKPTVMFWQKYGVPLNEYGATFREEMATAWVPLAMAGNYLGAIYGKTSADVVADFIVSRVLESLKRKS